MSTDNSAVFTAIHTELLDEYQQNHNHPWVVGYSGGKDSTLVAHLVFEMLLSLPPSMRTRHVHIVSNDTLVESPLVIRHTTKSLREIGTAATVFRLPVKTHMTRPDANQSFWVNLIGRGYPSPNRSFRWCTDRMKIQPTSRYIKERINVSGEVILLLGVRRSESASRSRSVARYDNGGRLNPHGDLAKCMVFRPIVDLSTDEVWEYLANNDSPWGGSHANLIKLYRDAGGGECPVVTQKSDTPSCGTRSSRFGCWTCTVVDKDRSLAGFVEAGFGEFEPLMDFRDWLVSIRNDPNRRQARRRNGRITMTRDGTFVPGPFTIQARSEIMGRLQALQTETNQTLISDDEIDAIHKIWVEDIVRSTDTQPMQVCVINKRKTNVA